jgi:hypothetical protein
VGAKIQEWGKYCRKSALKHLAGFMGWLYFVVEINPLFKKSYTTMNNNLHVNEFSVQSTIMKLALVSGALLSCMYGVLWIFASAFKVLG